MFSVLSLIIGDVEVHGQAEEKLHTLVCDAMYVLVWRLI